jgi:MFS family permease
MTTAPLDAATKRTVPWLVAVAFFMESLDTTILNTAVPTIAAALRIAPLSMKSVLSSYTLALAVFIPVSGWAAPTGSGHGGCSRPRSACSRSARCSAGSPAASTC